MFVVEEIKDIRPYVLINSNSAREHLATSLQYNNRGPVL